MIIKKGFEKYEYRIIKMHPLICGYGSWTDKQLKNYWGDYFKRQEEGNIILEYSNIWALKRKFLGSSEVDGTSISCYERDDEQRFPIEVVHNNPEYFEEINKEILEEKMGDPEKKEREKLYKELKEEFEINK